MVDPFGGDNPYQAPVADPSGPTLQPHGAGYWRQGKLLVIAPHGALPLDVCIATGKRADSGLKTKKLHWAHPALALLVLLNAIIYIIVYLVVRKTATIGYATSPEYRRRRRWGIAMAVLSPVLFAGGFVLDDPMAPVFAMLAAIVLAIVGIVLAQPYRIRKIDDAGHVHLQVKPEVLAALGL